MPVLFEAGGGMFDPIQAQVLWNPLFSNEIERQLADLKEWLVGTCLRGTSLMFDYGKRTQVGLIGPEKVDVDRTIPVVARYLENNYPDLRMFYTEYAIDVLARDITKRQGLRWLSERTEIPVREMAYIGDSSGDIEALESVGFSFAPANATEGVKSRARVVTEKHLIEGVIEAYLWCERYNKDNKEHPGDSISPG